MDEASKKWGKVLSKKYYKIEQKLGKWGNEWIRRELPGPTYSERECLGTDKRYSCFTGQMPFLSLNQQCKNTEGNSQH